MIVDALQDETIDGMAWRIFKNASSSLIIQIMELNPNLAPAIILNKGQLVNLPDNPPQSNNAQKIITLWD